ncbi:MAG: amidohydrolase [Gammaproteobacteria bacterium]|nr:amidohydrolase [Gammaproteobacteria bacterium]
MITNAHIHTQDAAHHVVAALAVRGNSIVATGSDADMRALAGPASRIVDLGGRVVLPGLIDAHIHPAESAQDLDKCNLHDRELAAGAVRAAIVQCLKARPLAKQEWFEAVQVNASGLVLARADLDGMRAGGPLVLESADGHSAWGNSAALAVAGIDHDTPEPRGGHIQRDPQGVPTGALRDTAAERLLAAIPKPSIAVRSERLERAFALMSASGLTSVQDASVGEEEMSLYQHLYERHRLKMRVRGCFHLSDLAAPADKLVAAALSFRDKWAVDPEFLRADAVKIFADGVIEYPTQTAALLSPYLDRGGQPTTNVGPSYFQQDNLNQIVAGMDAAGLTVHIHAIGDRAVRGSLDAFAYARARGIGGDNRDQIAHLQLIDPADFPRFKALGVIANFQLQWATFDPSYIEKATLPYLGPARSRYLYPARSLLDAGARIVGGSDWGVSTFNAFEAMEHAVTRSLGRGAKALLPEQAVPLTVMVDAYTLNAAYALRQEKTTGSLEPGKRADFIVLDRDIFTVDPFELHATRVLATYLDGHEVWRGARPEKR